MPVNPPHADADSLTALAESYLECLRRGDQPSVEVYVTQCPEQADSIRKLLATLRMMEDLGQRPRFGGDLHPSSAKIPPRLGEFELVREIARGGMGIVFEATQVNLGRRVAVKVLPPSESNDASRRARFQQEARAAAYLHHTNIVPVYDVGEQDQVCYYAMQFIDGESLAEVWRQLRRLHALENADWSTDSLRSDATLLRSISENLAGVMTLGDSENHENDGRSPETDSVRDSAKGTTTEGPSDRQGACGTARLPADSTSSITDWTRSVQSSRRRYLDNVVTVMRQVTDALAYAHSNGVLHRDVKPSNIILDTRCRAWLTDFGLAKVGADDLTDAGKLVGTLRYMSPERFSGRADGRSDVYGVGLLLYEFVTMRPAFEAPEYASMMHQIQHAEPTRPREIDPFIPKDLETIILSAIQKDSAKRYASAEALGEDLRRFQEGRPLLTRPTPSWEHAWRWCRRNPVVASLSTVLLGVILAAWVSTFYLWRRAESLHQQAQRNLDKSNVHLNLAIAAVDQFGARVSDDLRLNEHDLRPLRRELLQTAVDFHQRLLDMRDRSEVARLDLARAYYRLANLTAEIDAIDRAGDFYRRAVAEYDTVLRNQPDDVDARIELSRCLEEWAKLLTLSGQSEVALQLLSRGAELLRPLLDQPPPAEEARRQLARILTETSASEAMRKQFEAAGADMDAAIQHYDQLRTEHPEQLDYAAMAAQTRIKRSAIWTGAGLANWRDAEASLLEALAILREVVAHPAATVSHRQILARGLASLGRIDKVTGRMDAAIANLEEAIGILEVIQRQAPSVVLHSYELGVANLELGMCLRLTNSAEPARDRFQRACENLEIVVSRDSDHVQGKAVLAEILAQLAKYGENTAEWEEAFGHVSRGILLLDEVLRDEPDHWSANNYLPFALARRGELAARLGHFGEALADFDRAVRIASDEVRGDMRIQRAVVLVQSGDHRRSVRETDEALEDLVARCDFQFLHGALFDAMRVCGRAVTQANEDLELANDERTAAAEQYVAVALKWLRQAQEAGLSMEESLRTEPDCEPLRQHPDFASALATY